MAVPPIPDGYHTATPYLIVPGVAELIAFLKLAFDTTEINRHTDPQGNTRPPGQHQAPRATSGTPR